MKKSNIILFVVIAFISLSFFSCSNDEDDGVDKIVCWPAVTGYIVDFSDSPTAETQTLLAGEWVNHDKEYNKKGERVEATMKQISFSAGGGIVVTHNDGTTVSSLIQKRTPDKDQLTINTDNGTKLTIKKMLFDSYPDETGALASLGIVLEESKQPTRYVVLTKLLTMDEFMTFKNTLQATFRQYYVPTAYDAFFGKK